jgi:ectoine hydroxylase-related dioxygenase (phytanoyl-CoA dioxygenase family)
LIEADPGDLILWDSRTVHGGVVGPGDPNNTDELARLSFTICMTPRSKANEEVLK